jgi:sugar transferase (PEP-CTERM/EpsH1 system associated)
MQSFESERPESLTRPAVLYVTHRLPYPPDKGDRIRNYHLLRFLAARADVHLACLADEPALEENVAELRRLCARVAVVPLHRWKRRLRMGTSLLRGATATEGAFASPELRSILHNWGTSLHFDAVLASSSCLVPYLREPTLRDVPALVDLVDVDSQKWLDYAAAEGRGPLSWLYRLEGRRLRSLEAGIAETARAVTLVSGTEVEVFRRFCTADRVHCAVNGVDLDYFRPMPSNTQSACVFVGALDYRPNVDAARWFCTEVWPRIRQRVPGVELWLVGRNPAPSVRRLAHLPGVQLVGPVPDVRPYLARAAVTIAPLRLARGVQNKVLEALAMAKAVVASPPALAALGVQPGVHLLAAAAPAEWDEAVVTLLGDADQRRRLGAAGRAYVEQHHHWDRCLAPFADLLGLPETWEPVADEVAPPVVETKSA